MEGLSLSLILVLVSSLVQLATSESTCKKLSSRYWRKCGTVPALNDVQVPPDVARFGEYPWHVALVDSSTSAVVCSGVLVGHEHVVTAASCVYTLQDTQHHNLTVRLGEYDVTSTQNPREPFSYANLPVVEMFVHPWYDPTEVVSEFNIAVLRTSPVDVLRHPHVSPVCLPTYSYRNYTQLQCYVTGWSDQIYMTEMMNDESEQENGNSTVPDSEEQQTHSSVGSDEPQDIPTEAPIKNIVEDLRETFTTEMRAAKQQEDPPAAEEPALLSSDEEVSSELSSSGSERQLDSTQSEDEMNKSETEGHSSDHSEVTEDEELFPSSGVTVDNNPTLTKPQKDTLVERGSRINKTESTELPFIFKEEGLVEPPTNGTDVKEDWNTEGNTITDRHTYNSTEVEKEENTTVDAEEIPHAARDQLEVTWSELLRKAAVRLARPEECIEQKESGVESSVWCVYGSEEELSCKVGVGSPVVCQVAPHGRTAVMGIVTSQHYCTPGINKPIHAVSIPAILNFICRSVYFNL